MRAHRPIADLFKWALVTSILVHLFAVLGISFALPALLEQAENPLPQTPMKIILVPTVSEVEPDEHNTLAQANSLGEEEADTMILSPPFPTPPSLEELPPDAHTGQIDNFLHRESMESSQTVRPPGTGNPGLSRKQLIQEIHLAYLDTQARPRQKYVSTHSKESRYAAYIEQWRQRVERVGNLNYPAEAKSQKLEGSLVLDVAINAEGGVENVLILSSSGHKILDDSALRTIKLAAPFDRFPDIIRVDTDVLHIVRTWEYRHNSLTSSYLRGSQ